MLHVSNNTRLFYLREYAFLYEYFEKEKIIN